MVEGVCITILLAIGMKESFLRGKDTDRGRRLIKAGLVTRGTFRTILSMGREDWSSATDHIMKEILLKEVYFSTLQRKYKTSSLGIWGLCYL